jgi:hypothetical protein
MNSYSNVLQKLVGIDESLTIACPTLATALVVMYQNGKVITQQVVNMNVPDKLVTISLTGLASNADYFRLYVNQSPTNGTGTVPNSAERPSIFHVLAKSVPGGARSTVSQSLTVTRLTQEPLWQLAPVLTFFLQSRTGGNLSMGVKNNGTTAALNVMITGITQTDGGFTYNPLLLTPPFAVPGAANLKPGDTSGFNLSFITTGSSSGSFSFIITAQADNVPSFTIPINVK